MREEKGFLGCGFMFPPSIDPATGRFKMVHGEEDIRQSIYIILMTRLKSYVMQPEFGSRLQNYVFEITDDASLTLLRDAIQDALVRWEPRIIDVEAEINTAELFNGKVIFHISYKVRATNNPYNYVFPYYLYEGVGVE